MRAFRIGASTLAKLLESGSLNADVAALVREQISMRRARADQIERNAPIERARRLRRRLRALLEQRGDTWLAEAPPAVATAMPGLAATYGVSLARRGEPHPEPASR
jgi:hypothetical protein